MNGDPLRFLCFGLGAIGTYIGGSLGIAGFPVTFLERPGAATKVHSHGLHLRLSDGEHTLLQPVVAESLAEALSFSRYDAAIFAVKSFDTQAAANSMREFKESLPPILCLQNGVENEAVLREALGPEKVIPGTVTSAIGRRDMGSIVLERLRGMGVASGNPISERLVHALNTAGLNARLYPDADSMKWSKMLTNLLANASSAILDMSPSEIYQHPGLYRLELEQIREALKVMDALGLRVVDLPGTPVRLLAWAMRSVPAAVSQPLLRQALGSGRGGKMPSFHIDLYSGRKQSEVEYLNGAVVRFGAGVGVPTPVNEFFTCTLNALCAGNLSIETYRRNPEKLLEEVLIKGR